MRRALPARPSSRGGTGRMEVGGLVDWLLTPWSRRRRRRVMMFGPRDAGKTTLLYQIMLSRVVETVQTIGFN
eukprot:6447974-Prymnesium_polylepis.1